VARFSGKDGYFKVNETGSVPEETLAITNWTLNIESEQIENSGLTSDGWREFFIGMKSWTVSASAHWETTETKIYRSDPTPPMISVDNELDWQGISDSTYGYQWQGTVVVSRVSVEVGIDATVKYNITAIGTGELVYPIDVDLTTTTTTSTTAAPTTTGAPTTTEPPSSTAFPPITTTTTTTTTTTSTTTTTTTTTSTSTTTTTTTSTTSTTTTTTSTTTTTTTSTTTTTTTTTTTSTTTTSTTTTSTTTTSTTTTSTTTTTTSTTTAEYLFTDYFDDESLDARWVKEYGTAGAISETAEPGFLQITPSKGGI